jgi:protein-disulfide isomerase
MRRLRLIPLVLLLTLVPLTACGTAEGEAPQQSAEAERELLMRADAARSSGPEDAAVTLIEFFDFACSACQEFHRTRSDSLKALLGPDVRFLGMGFLIPRFPRSFHAAEAAMCAGGLGGSEGYAAMADQLLRNPEQWSDAGDPRPVFAEYAKTAKLDAAAFADCTARDVMAPVILSDLSVSSNFQAQATPTFVAIPRGAQGPEDVGRLEGVVPIAMLDELIKATRAKAK